MAQAIQSREPVTGTAVTTKKRKKFFLLDLYSTAVGKKYAMALSGIALIGFVVAHMVGNLKMYLPSFCTYTLPTASPVSTTQHAR